MCVCKNKVSPRVLYANFCVSFLKNVVCCQVERLAAWPCGHLHDWTPPLIRCCSQTRLQAQLSALHQCLLLIPFHLHSPQGSVPHSPLHLILLRWQLAVGGTPLHAV